MFYTGAKWWCVLSSKFEDGNIYIIQNSERKYEMYMDVRGRKETGLFVSRENPEKLPKEIAAGSEIIWLSTIHGTNSLDPYNVGILTDNIVQYVKEHPDSAVFLDGVEYMIEGTDFSRVFRSLGYLKERISLTSSIMLIPLDPEAVEKKEFALFKREFNEFKGFYSQRHSQTNDVSD